VGFLVCFFQNSLYRRSEKVVLSEAEAKKTVNEEKNESMSLISFA